MSYNPENTERVVRRSFHLGSHKTYFVGESKTDQSQAATADVNNIIRRYDRTGQLPDAKRPGQYGDVSELNADYGELIERSRNSLNSAGEFMEEKLKQNKAASDKAAEVDKAELAEYRRQKKSAKPADPSASS